MLNKLNPQKPTLALAKMVSKPLITAGLMAGLMFSVSAQAGAIPKSNNVVTFTVDIRDLQTERGIVKVYSQLSKRAWNACRTNGPQSLRSKRASEVCAVNLLGSFIDNMNNQEVTRYHERMTSV